MFKIIQRDQTTKARVGELVTRHGVVRTPAFMPVGTYGVVKTLTPPELRQAGVQMLLANAYHLSVRPGINVIRDAGGLHRFMGWDGAILTDSGGFQVMSLAQFRKVTDEGVEFQSSLDGSRRFLTPEAVIDLQWGLGVDCAVQLDVCLAYPAEWAEVERALALTLRWLERSKARWHQLDAETRPFLFGVIQGGGLAQVRRQAAQAVASIGCDGFALGGLSVGEPKALVWELIDVMRSELPDHAPIYLMGMGAPDDLWEAVRHGVDLFDCVLPTRNGRHGSAFTSIGEVNIRQAQWERDDRPLDPSCDCLACTTSSRAYLRHLFQIEEPLGMRLISLHNLRFYARLMETIHQSIQGGVHASAASSS